jgi:Thaumarchaeal output domain 1
MLSPTLAPEDVASPVCRFSGDSKSHFAPAQTEMGKVLVLGGSISMPRLAWHDDPTLPCSAVLLAGTIGTAEFAAAIQVMPDPAAPVADFANNSGIRSDFGADVLNNHSLAAARLRFTPILERLREIPFRAAREDRSEMLTLRLAYSRAVPIEARFAPDSSTVIQYPLLGPAAPKRAELEGLAFLDLLRRRHFMRVHVCDRCASHRLLAFEACHDCGGSDLADEAIVHHYRCGCQAPESRFVQDAALVCPNCHRNLKHFGMDYGKPGSISHCRTCGASSPEPQPRFACMDCTATVDGQQATATDWFHYDLTDAGILALRSGRPPNHVSRLRPEPAPGTCSLREFQLLTSVALRNFRKHAQPFTAAQLAATNHAALCNRHGIAAVDHVMHQACAIIDEVLSNGQFVTITNNTILVGLPEMTAAEAAPAFSRVRAAMVAGLDLPLEFDLLVHEGQDADALLAAF